jgi:multidrug resistance protein, MATE family
MESTAAIKDLKVQVTNQQILSIALPITFAILVPQINMLTNSIFLGHVGSKELGNAGITGVFYLIFAVAGHGLNSALQSVISRYAGSDEPGAFKTILSQGIRISLQFALAGILITWFIAPFILQSVADHTAYPVEMGFLRIRIFGLPFLYLFQMGNAFLVGTLNSRFLIIGFLAETFINIILDYLLIFGKFGFPQLGFNGAALASVIAEACACLIVFTVLIKTGLKKEYGLFHNLKYDQAKSKEIVRIATPLVLQFIISVTTWFAFFILIESLHDENAKAISNTMRNIFGLVGVFVWAFSNTCNAMVSNIMGQRREHEVIFAIKKIMFWSFGLCLLMVVLINIFPGMFFSMFGQGASFIEQSIPVLRMVSAGLLIMSIANIWLNGVTGTGKTRVNLAIELIAITVYLLYTWYMVKVNYTSLAMAWSNELVYWTVIFLMAFGFLKSGWWKTKER